jgi:hypothetical protein
MWLGGGIQETRNEPSYSIQNGEFLDQLSDYQVLKKWSECRGAMLWNSVVLCYL